METDEIIETATESNTTVLKVVTYTAATLLVVGGVRKIVQFAKSKLEARRETVETPVVDETN